MGTATAARERCVLRIRGVVQGVGFRPAMYRLAREHLLSGFVRNEADAVRLEVEGPRESVAQFISGLRVALPPAARVRSVDREPMTPRNDGAFRIELSPEESADALHSPIPPDLAPCSACLDELTDTRDRRFRYPFINCTDCGPRFTIVRQVPYDRQRTTMDVFALCAPCLSEYEDPSNRRFHAEPNACPDCGPTLSWVEGGAVTALGDAALRAAVHALTKGAIAAIKGAGGFLLAADAGNDRAVALLRERKRRPHKPFAVMVRDLEAAERLVRLDDTARAELGRPARPIVLAPRRRDAPIAAGVAPGLGEVGVFLSPTPLQYLLALDGPPAMVMTSGNRSDEPIARADDDALRRLAGIADGFLLHDRTIHARADDSVLRVVAGRASFVRRARGLVPEALALPVQGHPVLAVGGHLKNTVCIAKAGSAVLSPHVGNLANPDAFAFFEESIRRLRELTGIVPVAVAHDLHPEYLSTQYALRSGLPAIAVQHHHAHVAACLAEHGRLGPALGVVLDGAGHGPDGTSWGGELLEADLGGFRRVAHLSELELPGGEAAIREPYRIALAAASRCGAMAEAHARLDAVPRARRDSILRLLGKRAVSPTTTAAGRWFDAVAALAGVRTEVTYDGQAAIELEAAADGSSAPAYGFELQAPPDGPFVIDLYPAFGALARDLDRGASGSEVSSRFHATVAAALVAGCERARANGAPSVVALSGGCFQNRLLAETTQSGLEARGFDVLTHRLVPPNDGGLSLGQAAVATYRLDRMGWKQGAA